ncbi:MAG: serpin family protein [Bacteroidota bacterium]|nr:serpin family protein [Bacteroidota bacterium]
MIRITKILFIFFILLFAISCEDDSIDTNTFIFDDNETEMIKTINELGFSLVKEIISDYENNINISSLNTTISILSLYNASNDETKTKISNFLGLNNFETDEINNSIRKIIESFVTNEESSNFRIKNSLWIDDNYNLNTNFTNLAKFFLNTEIKNINYNSSIKDSINYWIMSNSNSSFSKHFEDKDIDIDEVISINASFYNLAWDKDFTNSYYDLFYSSDDNSIRTQYMNITERFGYLSSDGMNIVNIPSENEKYSVVIVVPKQDNDLEDILPYLNSSNWEKWNSNLTQERINLSIPYIDTEYYTGLNKHLESIGLNISSEENNISEISNDNELHQTIYSTNRIIFTNSIKTSKNKNKLTTNVNNTETINLNVNKTFFYAIKESSSNCILFTGIINKNQDI